MLGYECPKCRNTGRNACTTHAGLKAGGRQKCLTHRASRILPVLVFVSCWGQNRSFTWQEIRERFEAINPTLQAARISIDESKAQEITAYLRPNPSLTLLTDGTQIIPFEGVWRPFAGTDYSPSISYLHERN